MQFKSVCPYDGRVLEVFEGDTQEQVNLKINGAYSAFDTWRKTSFEKRAALMRLAAKALLKHKKKCSESITLEMGKPIKESMAEIEKCASVCNYYADHAAGFLDDIPLETPHGEAYIHFNPTGVVLAVMPWNFPFWQVFRFAAPAIMAGNTCLLKHASNVPRCALEIEQIFKNAGFPENIFNTLLIGSGEVQQVIEHEFVSAVTLTGSELAGGNVASIAGKNIKKSVLELGGSDAFIVLKDADIALAAKAAVSARMLNTGQSCIAAKRFIMETAIVQEFTEAFIRELEQLSYGNPMKSETDYGTLARRDLAEEIFDQVKRSIDLGAEVIYGQLPEKVNSAYFPPMILRNLKPGMPAYEDEIFGPVASFFTVSGLSEAIDIANESKYGLGGSVWTNNMEKAKKLADQIESGAVYVNQMMFSDPTVPFGGIKKSGYGRELSHLGIREFTNQKTVWIK
ncbi:MAG: NAD-dependent succinate-semialdehyde dehydrogenase [Cytophagales bacterium]|nr:NAD-dependent succinate-semialdehyde dehydrogenase [Cytophagales bacterium]